MSSEPNEPAPLDIPETLRLLDNLAGRLDELSRGSWWLTKPQDATLLRALASHLQHHEDTRRDAFTAGFRTARGGTSVSEYERTREEAIIAYHEWISPPGTPKE